ncbi:DUF6945 domain-containing protein [Pseudocitrobacter faecalis]|uniref:DUF6945 domain-containing protein n=1 Tax=Pseudocitrobacter faecalis TaxID=1398493 RepID=UPI0033160669
MTETEKTEKYAFFYKRLLHSTHIVRQDTGEEIEILDCIETLYGYMRDQYESYKTRGKPFFESQESMGLKFKGRDRRWIAARIEVLNRLGLVKSEEQERDSYGHKRFHHTVIPLEEVSDNLLFYGPASISGGILAEGMLIRVLEKKKPRGKPKSKKAAQPKIEESENGVQQQEHEQEPATVASESATDDPQQQSGIQQHDGDSGDDVSGGDDAVNVAQEQKEPQIATLEELQNWQNGGDPDGFDDYGAMWGKESNETMALINSHVKTLMRDGYKGSRSAANDDLSNADARYKQQQVQRAAAAKQVANTQQNQG